MKYIVLTYESKLDFESRSAGGDRQNEYWQAWKAYGLALSTAGVVINMHGMQPAETAATVTVHDGKRQERQGAYADTPYQLGGYFVIDVPDMMTALDWAARCTAVIPGAVEARPLL